MPVDKAFEEWKKDNDYSADEQKFGNNNLDSLGSPRIAIGYFAGFTAGQKSLSPEVREAANELLDWFCKRTLSCTDCNKAGCKGFKLGKLLAKE